MIHWFVYSAKAKVVLPACPDRLNVLHWNTDSHSYNILVYYITRGMVPLFSIILVSFAGPTVIMFTKEECQKQNKSRNL